MGGGEHWGGAKILQKIMVPPLSVIKVNKCFWASGEGGFH